MDFILVHVHLCLDEFLNSITAKKKYFYIATIAAFMLSGCEDFLDTENYTKKNTGNFPETVEDIDMMLNGVYVSLNHIISNSGRNSVESSPFFVS